MKVKIYANYGVLGHDKSPVYRFGYPCSEFYDKYDVIIPDCFKVDLNEANDLLITLSSGDIYLARDLIHTINDSPAFVWFDGLNDHIVKLELVK